MRCLLLRLSIICIVLSGLHWQPAIAQNGFNVQLFRPSPYFGRTVVLYSPTAGSVFTSDSAFTGDVRAGVIFNYQTASFVSKNATNLAGQLAQDRSIVFR